MKKNNQHKAHFIVYVRWDIILDWKGNEIVENKLSKNEHLKPYAYGTGARGISEKVKKGDILWIFTIPIYGNFSSFPSVVAMLTVDEVIDQENEKNKDKLARIPGYIRKHWDPDKKKGWKYAIIGNKDESHYFPLNNAYDLITKKILKDKSCILEKRISGKYYGYIAQYFQTIRRIPVNLIRDMISYKKKIHRSDSIFISYRRRSGSKTVKILVESLLKRGINCWLDINRMPQNKTRHYSDKEKQYFKNEIENAIHESKMFIAIISEDYFEREWTNLEFEIAKNHEKSGMLTVLKTELHELKDPKRLSQLVKQRIYG